MSGGGGGSGRVKETPEERVLAQIALERWNDYQTRFLPLENRLFGEVRSTEGEYAQASGFANAASAQAFDRNEPMIRKALFGSGARAGSGQFMDALSEQAANEVLSEGMNQVDTQQGVADQEVRGLQNVAALGRGQAGTAQALQSGAASQAGRQAQVDAQISLQNGLNRQQGLGTVAGIGTAYGLGRSGPATTQRADFAGLITPSGRPTQVA